LDGIGAGAEALEKSARQAKFKKRHIETLLCNHCRSRRAVTIRYSECVSVALVTQHAKRMRLIFVRGLPCCTVFSHIFS
jgi:hypothetical protein